MPYKKQIFIAGIVLLFLVILAWIFYRKGKKTVTLQYAPGELPGNPGSGNQNGASNDEIKRIANDLYADMSGVNWTTHNMTAYKQANLLNDADLIKLYNTYNTLYQPESKQTLTGWLESEFFNPVWDQPAFLLKARLRKLNAL